ncbi:MAG: hypothetical protein LBO00_09375, partial [Zoogloeaceae bacterium]|nr:hypothetical protein [Zoogloeaceae bacterium]
TLLALSRNHLCSKGATNYPAGPVKRVESIRFGLQGEDTRAHTLRREAPQIKVGGGWKPPPTSRKGRKK